MGFIGVLIGVIALGWVADLFSTTSDSSSEGNCNLHNEADLHHGCAGDNCENCRWYEGASCRWQENCYAPGKYHQYKCDNYESK